MCFLKFYDAIRSMRPARPAGFEFYSVYDVGDLISNHRSSEGNRASVLVSDADWDDLPGQIRDAVSFLKAHRSEIAGLIDQYGVADVLLDFPLWSTIGPTVANQNLAFPAELIAVCGELGIGLELGVYSREQLEAPIAHQPSRQPQSDM